MTLIPANLTPAERIIFARAIEQVNAVIGPDRIDRLLQAIDTHTDTDISTPRREMQRAA